MKIQLKSIKIYSLLSEETIAFTATLLIDGKKAAKCENTGKGGCTNYTAITSDCVPLIKKAEKYLESQIMGDGQKGSLVDVIDGTIEQEFNKQEQARFFNRMHKDMQHAILYGVPNSGSYKMISWRHPLSFLLQTKQGIEAIKKAINEIVLPNLTGGATILNNNLPEDIMKLITVSR